MEEVKRHPSDWAILAIGIIVLAAKLLGWLED
jgi:hypothetical protein